MLIKNTHIYSEHIDPAAISQFFNIVKHDEIVAGALMPDAHKGYSLPIGGVVAAKGMVFPSFVGYDQGCGMCAIPTSFEKQSVMNNAKHIWNKIQELIPVGFKHNEEAESIKNLELAEEIVSRYFEIE